MENVLIPPLKEGRKLLRVNLTTGEVKTEMIEERILRRYYGGGALATYFLLNELKPGIDPLGEENLLVITCSVLTGTLIPGASRYTIASKSPLTNGFAESEAGGFWGPQLAKAGYIGIIISGVSEKPVYLWIHNEKVEIRDAAHLTGKSTGEVEGLIREELGDNKIVIAQTGPAGEKLVKYACVLNNLKHANGRTGMGAVFGSKKLRGIAVRGTLDMPVANPDAVKEHVKWFGENWKNNTSNVRLNKYGTAHSISGLQNTGTLPSYNWRDGEFKDAEKFYGETMTDTILLKNEGCYACPVRCKRVVSGTEYNVDPIYGGPEYETIGGFGSICGISDLPAISKAHEMCNAVGLDTVSTSVVIGFAMECYEKGIITDKDTNGVKLNFGNIDSMLKMIDMIANGEAIGKLLGEGVAKAAKVLGHDSDKFAMEVKGQEFAAHDPRGKTGVGLGFAISPTGADHLEIAHDGGFADYTIALENVAPIGIHEPVDMVALTNEKLRLFYKLQQVCSLNNSTGMCNLVMAPAFTFPFDKFIEVVGAVTGWKISMYELMMLGERANNMARCFNVREGFTAADDRLPERCFEPLGNGARKGQFLDKQEFRNFIDNYYSICGWDTEGVPTPAKLVELELEWIKLS
jgi:aldehyde:ferredoxin oxidoreductase